MRMMGFVLIGALAGCGMSATTAVSVGSTTGPANPLTSASVSGYAESTSATGPLIGLAFIAANIYYPAEQDSRMSPLGLGIDRSAPALDPGRPVSVQDCSQPISNWSANLKCK